MINQSFYELSHKYHHSFNIMRATTGPTLPFLILACRRYLSSHFHFDLAYKIRTWTRIK